MPRFWWYDNDGYNQNHQSKNFGNDSRTIYFSNFFFEFREFDFWNELTFDGTKYWTRKKKFPEKKVNFNLFYKDLINF